MGADLAIGLPPFGIGVLCALRTSSRGVETKTFSSMVVVADGADDLPCAGLLRPDRGEAGGAVQMLGAVRLAHVEAMGTGLDGAEAGDGVDDQRRLVEFTAQVKALVAALAQHPQVLVVASAPGVVVVELQVLGQEISVGSDVAAFERMEDDGVGGADLGNKLIVRQQPRRGAEIEFGGDGCALRRAGDAIRVRLQVEVETASGVEMKAQSAAVEVCVAHRRLLINGHSQAPADGLPLGI